MDFELHQNFLQLGTILLRLARFGQILGNDPVFLPKTWSLIGAPIIAPSLR